MAASLKAAHHPAAVRICHKVSFCKGCKLRLIMLCPTDRCGAKEIA
jgi:hypothetical protein